MCIPCQALCKSTAHNEFIKEAQSRFEQSGDSHRRNHSKSYAENAWATAKRMVAEDSGRVDASGAKIKPATPQLKKEWKDSKKSSLEAFAQLGVETHTDSGFMARTELVRRAVRSWM